MNLPTNTQGPSETKFDRDRLLNMAQERAGLTDFGDTWFFEPMDRYIEAVNTEGRMTASGHAAQTETIVNGLVNRLRMIDDIRRNPEIMDETVDVTGIILGLPRTGSTIFHRLLASAPGMTAIRWFELQNYAPFPGEERGNPAKRRAYAEAIIAGWLQAAPELESIHPLEPDAPDEEILILGQWFVSTMVEGTSFVPSFARWMDDYDQSQGFEDLKLVLKYLQWQDPSRRGKSWILKSPSNLPYVEFAARAFPEAVLIMTHRDPLQTVPSYISMQAALYKLNTKCTPEEVGAVWFPRLAEWMRRFQLARQRIGEARFIDIDYSMVSREPLAQAERVLKRMGISFDMASEAMLSEFLAGNKREQRPMHDYSLERFGLSQEAIRREFASYRAQYIERT